VADLQTVIQAEERLVAVEDALAVATQERLEAAIDLYRAMAARRCRTAASPSLAAADRNGKGRHRDAARPSPVKFCLA
jgi:hypothetical protein